MRHSAIHSHQKELIQDIHSGFKCSYFFTLFTHFLHFAAALAASWKTCGHVIKVIRRRLQSFKNVIICVWKVLRELLMELMWFRQTCHISTFLLVARSEWFVSGPTRAGLCLLTGALFRPACRCPICSAQGWAAVSTRRLTSPAVSLHLRQTSPKTEKGFIPRSSANMSFD